MISPNFPPSRREGTWKRSDLFGTWPYLDCEPSSPARHMHIRVVVVVVVDGDGGQPHSLNLPACLFLPEKHDRAVSRAFHRSACWWREHGCNHAFFGSCLGRRSTRVRVMVGKRRPGGGGRGRCILSEQTSWPTVGCIPAPCTHSLIVLSAGAAAPPHTPT